MNARVYADLSGQKRSTPKFSASTGNTKVDAVKIMDGHANTFWSNNAMQQAGQWYCLDHGSTISINNICLVTGGARHNDYPDTVQFEYSDDGNTWHSAGSPQRGNIAIVNLSKNPIRARYVRFRIAKPRRNWLSICEFAVNRILPPYGETSLEERAFSAYSNTEDIGINRVMEVFPIEPGNYISLELPNPLKPEWLEINLENSSLNEWADVRITLESGKTVQLQNKAKDNRLYVKKDELPQERISSISVRNASDRTEEIKLTLFRIGVTADTQATDPRSITDADIATTYLCAKAPLDVTLPVPEGTTELITVGNAKCTVTNATLTSDGEHVRRFKLHDGAGEVHITHPQQEYTFLNEVIFK